MGENMCRCIYDMEVKERRKKVIDSELLLFSRRDGRSKKKGIWLWGFFHFCFCRDGSRRMHTAQKELKKGGFCSF